MTITVPSPLGYRSGRWRIVSNAARFVSPLTGVIQNVGRAGDYWSCELTTPPMLETEAMDWAGFVGAISGGREACYVRPPMLWRAKPSGFSMVIDGASQSGLGLAVDANQAGVTIPRGLFLSYETSTFRMLHLVTAPVTLDGAGKGTLPVVPAIRKSPSNGAAVNVTDPSCEMVLSDAAVDVLTLTDSVQFGHTLNMRERVIA